MKKNSNEVIELLKEAIELLSSEDAEATETKKAETTPKTKTSKKATKDDVEENDTETDDEDDIEALDNMSYNELKAYAKKLGIKAVGSHKQILKAVKDYLLNVDEDEEDEEEASVKSSKKSKKPEPQDEEEDDEYEEEPEDEDEETDDEDINIEDELSEMSVEELADILSQAGLSTKGKKEALIARIIKGIDDGKIELDFEEDDDEIEDEDEDIETPDDEDIEDDADEEDEAEDDDEEEDFDVNDTDNPEMTKARKKSIIALRKEIQASFKKKKLGTKEITEYLISVGYTKKELKGVDTDELLELYIDSKCSFIDDDGEEVEPESAYILNGTPACCGKFLEYEDDSYVCPVCGNEYEADDEE